MNAILQMRGAVLDEVMAAVKLLMDSQLFSCGMAAAISSHIRQRLGPNFSWQDFGDRVFLKHASLLDLEPLQELLTFLWTQLGLRMQLLGPYIKAQQLLRHPVSYLELQASWWSCILLWSLKSDFAFTMYSAMAQIPISTSPRILIWHEFQC